MPRAAIAEDWWVGACQYMARTGVSLQEAATALGVQISNEDAYKVLRRAGFNRILWQERHRYFNELASDPNFKKETLIGKMIVLAQRLTEEGQHDKAAEVLFKIAKMQGFVGPESTVSVFGELSQKDLDALREQVQKGIQPSIN